MTEAVQEALEEAEVDEENVTAESLSGDKVVARISRIESDPC
jgi:hypothetical protein